MTSCLKWRSPNGWREGSITLLSEHRCEAVDHDGEGEEEDDGQNRFSSYDFKWSPHFFHVASHIYNQNRQDTEEDRVDKSPCKAERGEKKVGVEERAQSGRNQYKSVDEYISLQVGKVFEAVFEKVDK